MRRAISNSRGRGIVEQPRSGDIVRAPKVRRIRSQRCRGLHRQLQPGKPGREVIRPRLSIRPLWHRRVAVSVEKGRMRSRFIQKSMAFRVSARLSG